MDGKQLDKAIRETFNLKPDDPITTRQVNYMLQMLRPTNYLLAHHKIKGNPVTYNIPNRDETKALMHRNWQPGILNDLSQDVVIEKSRQLGLSEVGVSQLIYFADTHSYDKVNCLYTFPTYRQLQDFYKQRIKTEFEDGYYSTLVDPKLMSMNQMKIRDSTVMFRSSSKGSSMEG